MVYSNSRVRDSTTFAGGRAWADFGTPKILPGAPGAAFAQTSLTLRSIVLITVSILPANTCLARLRVKPLAVWNGT